MKITISKMFNKENWRAILGFEIWRMYSDRGVSIGLIFAEINFIW